MKRWLTWLLLGLLVVLSSCGATTYLLYRASQQVPEFYSAAIRESLPIAEQRELVDELERRTLELHNQMRRTGQWESEFTDEQVNAWLATQLPEQFPRLMPVGTRDPRVKISSDSIKAACRWRGESLEAVISVEATVHLTKNPNQLAVRLIAVRAGNVPLPLGQLLDRISQSARKGGLNLTWAQEDGDPVALIQIPSRHKEYKRRELHLTRIQMEEGRVVIGGEIERVPPANAR